MIRNWWTSGKSRLKLEPIVNLKHQTRELPVALNQLKCLKSLF